MADDAASNSDFQLAQTRTSSRSEPVRIVIVRALGGSLEMAGSPGARAGSSRSGPGVAVSVRKDGGLFSRQHERLTVSIRHEPAAVRMVASDTIEVVQCRLMTTVVIDPNTLDPRSTITAPRSTTDAMPTDGALLTSADLQDQCPGA